MKQKITSAAKIALGSFRPICNTFRENDGKPVSIYDDQDMLDMFHDLSLHNHRHRQRPTVFHL